MHYYFIGFGHSVKLFNTFLANCTKVQEEFLSTPCFLCREKTEERKERERKREKLRVWLGETDNNYTCPRRPREPDHVAMETQVQQKVTRKSIQIELISLPFSLSFPSHFTRATKHASTHILTVAGLMQH